MAISGQFKLLLHLLLIENSTQNLSTYCGCSICGTKIEVLLLLNYSYNVTIVTSYYCNLVTFQTITPSYTLLVTKQVTSYITSYFKSNQLRNLVTKVIN